MPTTAGSFTALAGVATIVAGRLFGVRELYLLGTALVACVVVAVLAVRFRPTRLRVARRVTPRRVHARQMRGSSWSCPTAARCGSRVVGALRDPVSSTQGARLALAPLPPGGSAKAGYRLPTERRGRHHRPPPGRTQRRARARPALMRPQRGSPT
ncbi:MAG: hypothetical protein R2705_04160 [Ilumatobacteraceae bacterium]